MVNSPYYRISELVILALIIPFTIAYFRLSPYLLIFLWVIFFYCAGIYYICERKQFKKTTTIIVTKQKFIFIFVRWVCLSGLLYTFTATLFPDKLFSIQNSSPDLMWKLLILYPVVSAFPQEFIFCRFFFSRYQPLFRNKTLMVTMSALTFCIAHILFINWVAPVLGLVAGVIFALTYQKTKSLLLVSIEHGLYGDALFFFGLGWFFWGGATI